MPLPPAPSTLAAERIRRSLLLACLLLALLVVAAACGGDGGDDGDPDPDPDPGEMTITSISSLNPWLGDTITVTGTGFGGEPSDYIVRFPECEPAGCPV